MCGRWAIGTIPGSKRKWKLLVQRDEQIHISTQIFMTPLNGCIEDAEYGKPTNVHIQIKKTVVIINLPYSAFFCTGYLQRNYSIAQAVLNFVLN